MSASRRQTTVPDATGATAVLEPTGREVSAAVEAIATPIAENDTEVPPYHSTDLTACPEPGEPAGQLDGIDEFGPLRNWVSFDPQHGVFVCKSLDRSFEQFTAQILESRVVRAMKDENGVVLCASANRVIADTGRPGRECATCGDRDETCFPHWWIAWQELQTGHIFAHTLSRTASMNFQRYANELLREQLLPSQVVTRIFVQEARRLKTNTPYRRVQFERLDRSQPVDTEA